MMKRILGFYLTFMGGFVAALNISLLLPHSAGYEASWVKVALAVSIAIGGAFLSHCK